MNTVDLAGLLCWCLISAAFVATGSRVRSFNVVSGILLLVLAACFSALTTRPADAIAMMSGLVLYWVGLLILRAMLSRSVSLHMLVCLSNGQQPAIDDRIASRLDEALKYRLVSTDAELYEVSRYGLALDVVLARLYRAVGID